MFRTIGHAVVSFRVLVILVWIALAVVLGLTAPSIRDVSSSDQTSFLPSASDSITARALEAEKFDAGGSAGSGLLVFVREGGLTPADHAFAEDVHNWLLSPEGPAIVQGVVSVFSHPEQAGTLISPDNAAMLLTVNLTIAAFQPAADELTHAVRERVEQGKPDGLTVHFSGEAGIGTDLVASVAESTDRTSIVTVVLVIALLFFIYRSPLAVLIPLITITLAYLVSRGILGYLAQAGWQISSLLDTYMVVLVFGAGTDYSLFFISRFREELAQNPAYEAAVRSVQRIGAVISASALTTMVGLSALGMARFGIVRTMGPGLALAVGITLLAGLTLTPALLSLFGRHLFWPRKTSVENTQPSAFWVRVSNLVAIRPLIPVIIITALLALPYLGLTQFRENIAMIAALPKTMDSRQGFDAMARHYPPGEFAPATVLLEFPGDAALTSTPYLRALGALQDELLALSSVAQTRSLIDPSGDGAAPVFSVPGQLDRIAASLRAPPASQGEAAGNRLGALAAQVDALRAYLAELGDAFPGVAQGAQFVQARDALAHLATTATALRSQAHPGAQLRQMAAQLRAPAPSAGASDPTAALAGASRYLAELPAAFPDVRAEPAYGEAAALLETAQQFAQASAGSSGLSAEQRAARQSQFIALTTSLGVRLERLAAFFVSRPDAEFTPGGAPAAESADSPLAAATLSAADSLTALRAVFAAYPHPYFIPTALPGAAQAASALTPLFIADDGATMRFFVILAEDPLHAAAIDELEEVRETLRRQSAGPLSSARISVGGATAEIADMWRIVRQDIQAVGVVTVVGIFGVLAILLRSLVAPIYLVATVVFSYGSSLGLVTLLFQGVLGHDGVYYLLPLTMMVMLVALGADYNVFLVHRIREESASLPLREGVRVASARTGAIITAAGVILAGTFGALTAAPLEMLFQTGAAIALGILIDALVVRSLLVPGIATLVGNANWWPASVRANWWPLLPAGTRAPLGGEQGLARGIVFAAVAALIAVTFATRNVWYPDTAAAATGGRAAAATAPPATPTSTPQLPAAAPQTPQPAPAPTPGGSPTPAPTPTLPPSTEYVVQAGDTLTAIAQEFGVTVAALAELNEIEDPDVIYAGQRLRIPSP